MGSKRLRVLALLSLTAGNYLASVHGQLQFVETRETYVPYPPSAADLLLEEVEDVGDPLLLEVVTSLAPQAKGRNTAEIWDLLKGIVHRFHNQNQVIHVLPHFYITKGMDIGCRIHKIDEDTGHQIEDENLPLPPHCVGACTNHGRYCVVAEETKSPPANQTNNGGAMLVEETLRRICITEIYHGSDLRFWEYMETFERLQCRRAGNMRDCAMSAVDAVPRIDYNPIADCVRLAGGLDKDGINVRLQREVDKQTDQFALKDVPYVRVPGKKYTGGIWNVPVFFDYLCGSYREVKGVVPIACQFCDFCNNVRQCLWQLQCDGRPFDPSQFQDPEPPTTARPIVPNLPTPPPTSNQPTPAPSPATIRPTFHDGQNGPSALPVSTPALPTSPAPQDTNQSAVAPMEELGEEPQDSGPLLVFIPFTHPPMADNSTLMPVSSQVTVIHTDDKRVLGLPPYLVYGAVGLAITCLLAIIALVSYLQRRHHQRRVNSAEEYFNELMNESYKDNMAASGRFDCEASDRSMEDYFDDYATGAIPPAESFKVKVVLV